MRFASTKAICIGILTLLSCLDAFVPPTKLPPQGPLKSDRLGNLYLLHWIWHQSYQLQIVLSFMCSIFLVMVYLRILEQTPQSFTKVDAIAMGVAVGGWSLRQWSKWILADSFTYQISSPPKLIQDIGPYQVLIHPGYSGALGQFAGLLFLCHSSNGNGYDRKGWVPMGIGIALVLHGLLRRIDDEETLLEETFGQEWYDHVASRWRLVPFIY